ncbi:MAG TPA: hypothetical protein PLI03_12770, partial [Chitinophagales bacterium]|nr:hypothetical protein [Chitinophagales bacterium]
LIFLAWITLLFVSGCAGFNRVEFDHSIQVSFNINPVNPGSYTYAEVLYTNDLEQVLNDHKASLDHLESLKLKGFEIWITAPDGATADPFDNLFVYVEAEGHNEQLLATLDPVPDGGQQYIAFKAETDVELAGYFRESEITFRLKGANSGTTTEVTTFDATVYFKLEASVL